jgi:hypothetical protein
MVRVCRSVDIVISATVHFAQQARKVSDNSAAAHTVLITGAAGCFKDHRNERQGKVP